MATRFLHMGLQLEESPYSDVAPFAVDENGVLAITRGNQWKNGSQTVDPQRERIPVSRMIVLPATTVLATVAEADHGAVFVANSSATVTLQLPAASAKTGLTVTLTVGVLTSSGGHKVKPASGDTIVFTSAAAGSSVECSAATDVLGDSLTLVADGGTKWYFTAKTGTWAAIA